MGTNLRGQWKNKMNEHRYMTLSQGKSFITLYTNLKTMKHVFKLWQKQEEQKLNFLRFYFCHNEIRIIYNSKYIVSEMHNKLCRDKDTKVLHLFSISAEGAGEVSC